VNVVEVFQISEQIHERIRVMQSRKDHEEKWQNFIHRKDIKSSYAQWEE